MVKAIYPKNYRFATRLPRSFAYWAGKMCDEKRSRGMQRRVLLVLSDEVLANIVGNRSDWSARETASEGVALPGPTIVRLPMT